MGWRLGHLTFESETYYFCGTCEELAPKLRLQMLFNPAVQPPAKPPTELPAGDASEHEQPVQPDQETFFGVPFEICT